MVFASMRCTLVQISRVQGQLQISNNCFEKDNTNVMEQSKKKKKLKRSQECVLVTFLFCFLFVFDEMIIKGIQYSTASIVLSPIENTVRERKVIRD